MKFNRWQTFAYWLLSIAANLAINYIKQPAILPYILVDVFMLLLMVVTVRFQNKGVAK